SEEVSSVSDKLQKVISASNISKYFYFRQISEVELPVQTFSNRSILYKKERTLDAVIDDQNFNFYVVPNWEINNNSRLFNLISLMGTFNERCCYSVDFSSSLNVVEEIHKNFDKPLNFLRNAYAERITLGSKQPNRRDPNVDETIRQYEDWLKKIDTSMIYRCRIQALSNNIYTGQLLLNAVFTEAIKSGNAVTKEELGKFQITSDWNNYPDGYFMDNTPVSMQQWSTTFTDEELCSFICLPVLYDGETIEIPKETAIITETEGIYLGNDTNLHKIMIPEKALPKHMFVCGVPGSGKTNTMLHIASSLYQNKIPFLVLEPAKKEYRELALFNIPELLIFSPSANTNFPLEINPFEFPKGLTLSEHIENLCKVFEGAFPMPSPSPKILSTSIQVVYEKKGWNYKDINNGTKDYPTLSELYSQFEIEIQKTSYDGEMQGNVQAVLQVRIGSLLERERKEIFDVKKSTILPEEWLTKPIIIELEALGEGPANFVTLLLCTLIRETLKVEPLKDKEKSIRHVIFIEEAHNLISSQAQVDAEDSNPKIAATAFIVKMLAEVRALREGIIIADQLPTAMASEVIKNTNIKLVHRLTSSDDRELVGSTMSASPLQMENMATYLPGQALFSYEKLLKPFEMRVCTVEEHGEKTPNDEELYELMLKKPNFFKMHKSYFERRFNDIVDKVTIIHRLECDTIQEIRKIHFSNLNDADFYRLTGKYNSYIENFNDLKNVVYNECKEVPDMFIQKVYKDELLSIISSIGNLYEKELKLALLEYIK
ncbi:MAG: DUF87 domain-containing protein, partial [Lachnospiraceae bacterium]|nr:DUF87 domain-containing protein [Lachnospiraceae bacterium]